MFQLTKRSELAEILLIYVLSIFVYYMYTLNHKKRDILFLTTTLANLRRFL